MAEVVAVVLGIAFLYVFYRAVETSWPMSYYSVGHKTDQTLSKNLLAYLLFRFAPVYATGIFAGAALASNGSAVVLPVLAIAIGHGLLTSGRLLFGMARRHVLRTRPLVASLNMGVLALTILVGVAAGLTASAFTDYIPAGRELTISLWTAVLAAVVGAFLLRVTTGVETDPESGFARSRDTISEELWLAAGDAAEASGAEARLVHAFMLVENAQRPKWARRLEYFAGRVVGRGTYGPLQATSDAPLADKDALAKAVVDRFAGRRVPINRTDWGDHPDIQWLRTLASMYNPDESYINDVVRAYGWVERPYESSIASSAQPSSGGLPKLGVNEFGRGPSGLRASGTVAASHDTLHVRFLDASDAVLDTKTVAIAGSSRLVRRKWAVSSGIPGGAVNVELALDGAAGCSAEDMIRLPI